MMEMRRNIIADEACAAFLACAGRARAVVDVVFASHQAFSRCFCLAAFQVVQTTSRNGT